MGPPDSTPEKKKNEEPSTASQPGYMVVSFHSGVKSRGPTLYREIKCFSILTPKHTVSRIQLDDRALKEGNLTVWVGWRETEEGRGGKAADDID